MVSKPSFDPNTIVDAWDAIVNDPNQNGELLNRCTQGLYAPGSTFKIFMTLAYLREHGDDPSGFQFNCTGAYQDPSDDKYIVHCFDGEVHGQEDLSEAFANSCNAAFSEMGTTIDRTELRKLCDSMYFNEDLPIALTKSRSRFTVDATTDTWTMMQTAIGQGNTMMSPLHSVLITAAIANGGISMEPQLLMQITSSDGEIVRTFNWQDGNRKTLMNQEEASVLASYMRKVVTDGTASRLRDASYEAAGKTGSAEVTKDGITKTNAWFTGFAPYSSPRIAVCVVVEDGETGGRTAVPIAKKVMDYWIQKGQ
jgi:cell division protein FtsI/penicillin-binding protein 2